MLGNNVLLRICEVVSVHDENGGFRIKVRLPYEDANKTDAELPYCFPLLPMSLHIHPKINETVLVILEQQDNTDGNRFFIGPIISQPYDLDYSPYRYSSRSLLSGKQFSKPLPDHKMNVDNDFSLPKRENVSILGRDNEEVSLGGNQIVLRCGHRSNDSPNREDKLKYNDVDYGFIQMRYKKFLDKKNDNELKSVINVVADRINLLSHDSTNYFDTLTTSELVDDETLEKVLEKAHPLPYGDVLIDYLKSLVRIIREHVHPMSMLPPVFNQADVSILSKDLDKMLSKTIRIN